MPTVRSADGTAIAYDEVGSGAALVVVGSPPMADRAANAELVEALAPHFTVYNYDRRGRGESSDGVDYHVEREYEDLAAVVGAAGGEAAAFGSSGGGIMALEAATRSLGLTALVVWEPPYILDGSRPRPPADFGEQLEKLLAADRRADMVEAYLTSVIGMPADAVGPMRDSPMWAGMEAGAHTLIRDLAAMGGFVLPQDRLAAVDVPTLVVDGGDAAAPWIRQATEQVTRCMPTAKHATLEGQPHNVDPQAIAGAVREFLG